MENFNNTSGSIQNRLLIESILTSHDKSERKQKESEELKESEAIKQLKKSDPYKLALFWLEMSKNERLKSFIELITETRLKEILDSQDSLVVEINEIKDKLIYRLGKIQKVILIKIIQEGKDKKIRWLPTKLFAGRINPKTALNTLDSLIERNLVIKEMESTTRYGSRTSYVSLTKEGLALAHYLSLISE